VVWVGPSQTKINIDRDVTYSVKAIAFVNNRFKKVTPLELENTMPCLLKGGKHNFEAKKA